MAVEDRTAQTDPRVYDSRPEGTAITCLLIHHTADPNAAAEEGTIRWLSIYHANPVSCHKVFKRNGDIIKIVPESKRAWHAGASRWAGVDDVNNYSIGYEVCNNGLGEAYTAAQYRSLAESIAYDCALYHIRDSDVTSHKLVRELWNGAHPLRMEAPKTDPFNLDIDRVFREVWEVRAHWPAGWPAYWHHWLDAFGRPR